MTGDENASESDCRCIEIDLKDEPVLDLRETIVEVIGDEIEFRVSGTIKELEDSILNEFEEETLEPVSIEFCVADS